MDDGKPINNAREYSGAVAIGEKIYIIGRVKESDDILVTVHYPYHASLILSLIWSHGYVFFSYEKKYLEVSL